jgi:thiamine-phosphate pyrophosphorylase
MKLMVISSPVAVPDEALIMNRLFAAGLEVLHLRKPSYSKKELIDLALQIEEPFRQRLALHSHHLIADNLGVKRIHFPEAIRLYTSEHELKRLRAKNYILSTSIHSAGNYQTLPNYFAYTFLGPVFKSISKENYGPATEHFNALPLTKRAVEIIAIGGITPDKLNALQKGCFDGAALHGAIWTDPEKAIETFQLCQGNANL